MTTLTQARADLTTLTAKAEALSASGRSTYGTDPAIGSGIRRKPNPRADARRFNAYDREAAAWAAVTTKTDQIAVLEYQAKVAIRDTPVPYTPGDLKAARYIRTKHGWHEIVRVSAKSVSVRTPWSWTDRVSLDKIIEVRA